MQQEENKFAAKVVRSEFAGQTELQEQ